MRVFVFLLLFLVAFFLFYSCKGDKKEEKAPDYAPPVRADLSMDSKIFLGNRLFSEKTCITCHDVDQKIKGPSVTEIMQVYKENNADIVAFLKGKSKPIVDTDPEQVAIMQENIDGFLKDISDVELDAIATYMLHVDELKRK